MEIRVLEYVIAVYEEQSFTRAAARLCVAQPSLSQQIAKLERELGLQLFQRGSSAVTVTPDGARFVERAEQILHLHRDLRLEMQERTHGMGTSLAIGTTAITGGHVLPQLLRAFHAAHPTVHPRLVEDATEALTDLAARGLIHLAILSLPLEDPRLSTVPLLTEPLLMAFPPTIEPWMSDAVQSVVAQHSRTPQSDGNPGDGAGGHSGEYSGDAERGVRPLSLHLFADAPFVMLKQGFGFRRTLLQLCADSGFQPTIAYETSSIDTAQSLVAHGLGVTLVPQMVTHPHTPTARTPCYATLDSSPTRTLVFAYPKHRHLSLAARAFMTVSGAAVM